MRVTVLHAAVAVAVENVRGEETRGVNMDLYCEADREAE
jgi:hypothetical protein